MSDPKNSNLVVATYEEAIRNTIQNIQTGRQTMDNQKKLLETLYSSSEHASLIGLTAQEYEQIHTALVKIATTASTLMGTVVTCIDNAVTAQAEVDKDFASRWSAAQCC
jgi:hypothetical protein